MNDLTTNKTLAIVNIYLQVLSCKFDKGVRTMKRCIICLLLLMLTFGAAYASGGKNQGTTGKGTTSTGTTSQGAGTQDRTGR